MQVIAFSLGSSTLQYKDVARCILPCYHEEASEANSKDNCVPHTPSCGYSWLMQSGRLSNNFCFLFYFFKPSPLTSKGMEHQRNGLIKGKVSLTLNGLLWSTHKSKVQISTVVPCCLGEDPDFLYSSSQWVGSRFT